MDLHENGPGRFRAVFLAFLHLSCRRTHALVRRVLVSVMFGMIDPVPVVPYCAVHFLLVYPPASVSAPNKTYDHRW